MTGKTPQETNEKSSSAKQADDFESVAARLGCSPDMKEFDAKMKKIAKAKPKK